MNATVNVVALEARFEHLKQGNDVVALVALVGLVTEAFIELSSSVDVRIDLVERLRRLHCALHKRILLLDN